MSDEETDQIGRLRYILGQGCLKEGLVASPRDWPGASTTNELWNGHRTVEGIWIDRDGLRRARARGLKATERDFTIVETLHLTPVPALAHLSWAEYCQQVREIVHEIESETKEHNRLNGRTPMGAKRLREIHPHARPKNLDRSPAPRFHAKSRKAWQAMRDSLSGFLQLYREAAELLKAGDRDAEFPEGSFPPRLPFVHAKLVPD